MGIRSLPVIKLFKIYVELAAELRNICSQKCINRPKGAEHRNIFCFFVTVRCTFNKNS